jgi:hypothetical protein
MKEWRSQSFAQRRSSMGLPPLEDEGSDSGEEMETETEPPELVRARESLAHYPARWVLGVSNGEKVLQLARKFDVFVSNEGCFGESSKKCGRAPTPRLFGVSTKPFGNVESAKVLLRFRFLLEKGNSVVTENRKPSCGQVGRRLCRTRQ